MDKQTLKKEFKKGFKKIKFDYDTFAMTWGVSHYRFAKSQKRNFSNIEEFFKEVMLSPDGLESSNIRITNLPWNERTDFEQFVDGLIFKKASEESLNNLLQDSIETAKKYEQDWEEAIDLDNIKIPEIHKNVIEIRETENSRFAINTYIGFVSENDHEYFFYESQFES